MTNLERLKAIQKAYYMLIPCVKNNAIQDYLLVLTQAPGYLTQLIREEEAKQTRATHSTEIVGE